VIATIESVPQLLGKKTTQYTMSQVTLKLLVPNTLPRAEFTLNSTSLSGGGAGAGAGALPTAKSRHSSFGILPSLQLSLSSRV